MQQVYEAEDLAFQRSVAVKVPKDRSAEKRFNRSAQVSARITHQNIAKTLDFFEEEGSPYLVEELISGKDLDASLKTLLPYFDPHLAAHFIHQFAKGLSAAHHADVFHRDLKPSNIMVSGDLNLSVIKITDFGIAKMAATVMEEAVEGAATGETSITGSQTAMGTLPYMAPEMIETPKLSAKPADIWALGAILYRVLAGSVPFGSGLKAIPSILEARIPKRPNILETKTQFSELANGLWEIVESCLQKDASARPSADSIVNTCNKLCYSEAKRMSATISDYGKNRRRHGFLKGEDNRAYFFHEDSYFGEKPIVGQPVVFSAFEGTPYPRAFPVLPLKTKISIPYQNSYWQTGGEL